MNINNKKFSIIASISLISVAILTSFNGCGYDEECCSLTKSPTAVITGFTDKEIKKITTVANQPIFLSVNGQNSFDDGRVTKYEWFVNGASVSNTMIGNLEVKPGLNDICLLVTDDENRTNKTCQSITFQAPDTIPEELSCEQKLAIGQGSDPKALLILTDDETKNPVINNTVERSKTYSLSCENSVDDCGKKVKECEWSATSYLLDPTTGVKTPFVVDCFEDGQHDGHGAKFTTTESAPSFITLCTSTDLFNRIEVSLKVTDEYNNTTTTTETYTVIP